MITLNERVEQSTVVLANATELVTRIVLDAAGNDIANTLNGTKVSSNTLRTLVNARMKRNFDAVNR